MVQYKPGTHPGQYLLPASELCLFATLPQSVKDQIHDCRYYDYYGDNGLIYEKSAIDRPIEEAEYDYERWL